MNLSNINLGALVDLWHTSYKNPILKSQIEVELQKRIPGNDKFYREYFFQICKIKNSAITIYFIPTSDAYKSYGASLGIDIILSDEELGELIKNYSSKPIIKTGGIIRAKILGKTNLTLHQITMIAEEGFDLRNVYEVHHV